MIISRLFSESDAQMVSNLVATTMLTTNIKDYTREYLEKDIKERTPYFFIKLSQYAHCYVFIDKNCDEIIGYGAIGPYWDKKDESSLFNIFIRPDYQGRGIGRKLIYTLENDPFFKRAKRIEVPASITALEFYEKMGYTFKNDDSRLDDERLFHLEKYNSH